MDQFRMRFKKLMEDAGLTEEQMAMLLDVGPITVEGLLSGYIQPNENILKRTAQIFNVSLRYIALLDDDPKCEEDPFIKEIYVVDSVSGVNGEPMRKDIVGSVYMNADEMHGKEYLGVLAQDDTMRGARIYKGDIAVVKRQTTASDGEVVCCRFDGETVLRWYNRKGNIVLLTSDGNGTERPVIKIDTTETPFIIIGVVKEVRIKPLNKK